MPCCYPPTVLPPNRMRRAFAKALTRMAADNNSGNERNKIRNYQETPSQRQHSSSEKNAASKFNSSGRGEAEIGHNNQ